MSSSPPRLGRLVATLVIAAVLLGPGPTHPAQLLSPLTPATTPVPSSAGQPAEPSGAPSLALTAEERAWLQAHPVIRAGLDPIWRDADSPDGKGHSSDIPSDYVTAVEQLLGFRFERIETLPREELIRRMQRWEIDVVTSVAPTPSRQALWSFTRPYLQIPIVIMTRSDVPYVAGLGALAGKKVVVVENHASAEWVARDHPALQLVKVARVTDGFDLLRSGEAYALVDNLMVLGWFLTKQGISDLKITGTTPYISDQCMAVRKDWAILAGILQKALDAIPESERARIYDRRVLIRYEHGFDYRLLWWPLAALLVTAMAMLVWIRTLSREIQRRRRTEAALAEAGRRKDEFLAMLGHELRNPLAPICNAAYLLKKLGLPDPRAQRAQEMIERQATHLTRIVDDLLDVSRITRGKMVLRNERVDWAQIVRNTAEDHRESIERRGLALETSLPEEPVWVMGDATRLSQVVANVLDNSAKFTDAGAIRIDLQLERSGTWSALSVTDTGIGMTPETLSRIFEPFVRAEVDLARTRGGLGLGAALTKGLVESFGGTIEIASDGLGRGTRFTIHLPLAVPDASALVDLHERGQQVVGGLEGLDVGPERAGRGHLTD